MPLQLSPQSRVVVDTLSRLAKTIALPNEYPPTRLPTQNAIERTAVTQFQITGTSSLDGNNGGIVHALLMRHPAIPLWLTQTFTSMGIEYGSTIQEAASVALRGPTVFTNLQLDTAVPFGTGLPAPLTSNVIPFAQDTVVGADYFYVPAGGAIFLRAVSSAVQASGEISAQLMQWNGPGQESLWTALSMTWAGSNVAMTPLPPTAGAPVTAAGGWYRFTTATVVTALPSPANLQFTCGWITGGAYAVPAGTIAGMYPAGLVAEWTTSIIPFANTRVTASGLLLSNVTKVLNKEGTVLAARLTPDQSPFSPSIAALGSRNVMEKYFGPLEQGVYTFTSPTPESMTFTDATVGSSTLFPFLDLNKLGMVNLVRLSDPSVVESSTMAFTVDWHVEFRTTSVLFPLGVTATPLEEFQAAQVALALGGNFFENPLHLGAIGGMVGKAAGMVAKTLGPVLLEKGAHALHMKKPQKVSMQQVVPGSQPKSRNNNGKDKQKKKK